MIQANREAGLAGDVIFTGELPQDPNGNRAESLLLIGADDDVDAVLPRELRHVVMEDLRRA
jgi:hypothetical protein